MKLGGRKIKKKKKICARLTAVLPCKPELPGGKKYSVTPRNLESEIINYKYSMALKEIYLSQWTWNDSELWWKYKKKKTGKYH